MKIIIVSGIILLALIVCFQPVSADQAEEMNQTENIWNGTWADDMYLLYFQQNGTNVSGIYEPYESDTQYDLGKLVGNLSSDGTRFTGKWIVTSTVTLNLSDDEKSITGSSTDNPIKGLKEIKAKGINGNRTEEITDKENPWTGTWVSSTKIYNLTQAGSSITGDSAPLPEFMDGYESIEGNISPDGTSATMNSMKIGGVTLVISNDGSYYNGTYTDDLSGSQELLYRNMTRVK